LDVLQGKNEAMHNFSSHFAISFTIIKIVSQHFCLNVSSKTKAMSKKSSLKLHIAESGGFET